MPNPLYAQPTDNSSTKPNPNNSQPHHIVLPTSSAPRPVAYPPLNKRHIPLVPASGFDVSPKGQQAKGQETDAAGSMSSDSSKMSQATRELLRKAKKMVPPMLEKFHKGQMGRIAVIGGSEDYTGAPYFSAMASARLGADMSHIICEPQAAQVIKTYSPNLMVHPLLRQSRHATTSETASSLSSSIIDLLPRFHVLVIGPGLGRDQLMQDTCASVISEARKKGMPLVLDADGLLLAQNRPELVHGYRECILTPNVVEFARLCKAQGIDPGSYKGEGEGAAALAGKLGGVTVLRKGARDWISDGERTVVGDLEGGLKRSGGQGDTLTGSIATFLGWRKAYLDGLWEHDGELDEWELLALAAFGGSCITRESSRLAFAKRGRSLQASDLTDEVEIAFQNLFEDDTAGSDAKL
ncbi:hypothetical protein V495_05409 [Pseudogymnoascus sp. VKM F-4514 (FW-929)]|nr:hypothetical protein V495_05409 [Pseudogymnoascus sp. VKM F-4514 (FW-929)]KFY56783.1 hypothetical protein V497_05995 [Pseudogymnoascus sp. VKM F-4516 (FW-969)]